MQAAVERLACQHQARDKEDTRYIDDRQTSLRLKNAFVPACIAAGEEVVEEVPEDLTQESGDDGGEVQVPQAEGGVAVAAELGGGGEEDGGGDVDADGPHEDEEVGDED